MTASDQAVTNQTIGRDLQDSRRAQRIGWRAFAALAAVLALSAAVAFFIAGVGRPAGFHGIAFTPPPPAPSFTLMNQDRQSVRYDDLQGQPILVYFGWTNCKKACPLTLTKWKRVANLLQPDADRVRFVFISIDPKRDSPEVVKAYLAAYDPKFIGLVGTLEEIDTVLQEYLAFYKEDLTDPDDPSFLHTTTTYVIDKSGRLVLAFGGDHTAEEMAADLRVLLKQ